MMERLTMADQLLLCAHPLTEINPGEMRDYAALLAARLEEAG